MSTRNPEASEYTSNWNYNENSTHSRNDEYVISGISGRFPESNSTAEFEEHLFAGRDMITDDGRRWPSGK